MHNKPNSALQKRFLPLQFTEDFPVRADIDLPLTPLAKSLPEYLHYHNAWELGICHKGHGLFFAGAGIFPFGPGDIMAFSPGQMHLARSMADESQWTFIQFMADKLWGQPGGADGFAPQFIRRGIDPLLAEMLLRIRQELIMENPDSRLIIKGLLQAACVIVERAPGESAPCVNGDQGPPAELLNVLASMANSYPSSMTIARYTDASAYSPTHLRRVFKQYLGYSPQDYLIALRVSAACALLSGTDLSIQEIAAQSGFGNISTFNRHFKRNIGESPRRYRQTYKISE
jgi:AraC family transcriptional regulator, activator of mtrCDE